MVIAKKSIFNKPVAEIIEARTSVRSYESEPLEESIRKSLKDYYEGLEGPFNVNVRFKLIDSKSAQESNIKLGTYGVVKGASSFIASAVEKGEMNLEELGYELESLILYATSLGIGTCWMGGTFKKGEFVKAMDLKEEELLPIITPVGYPSKNRTLRDSLMRAAAGSKNRKSWEDIFFNGSFNKRLVKDEAGIYISALEMVRLAPSASNKQPWRIVKDNDKFHFYICHAKGYSSALGFDMQRIDMGIAMCHFEYTLLEADINGSWKKMEPDINKPDENIEYIISWMK